MRITDEDRREAAAERVAQGLPAKLEDPATLARIAAIMREAQPPIQQEVKPKRRRRVA